MLSKSLENTSSQAYHSGCFYQQQINQKKEFQPLPIRELLYQINITNGLSQVTIVQQYQNNTQKFLEIVYKFPVSPEVCIHKFSAIFSNKRLEGIVKEKQEAKKQYRQALAEGKRAAYSEIDSQTKDMLTLKIGNINPGQKVRIEISYISQLEVVLNTFYKFTLPIKNLPKYLQKAPSDLFVKSFKNKSDQKSSFGWDFKMTVKSNRKITSFQSQTHQIKSIKSNDSVTEVQLTLNKGSNLQQPFSFIYSITEIHLPSYLLGRTDSSCTVMASFIPKFCSLNLKDAQKQALKSQQFQTDMDAARGEYIFLLDRSGSMDNQRIKKAKQALILFLKSLPVHSYFNVISFGNVSSSIFQNSQQNSVKSIQTAIELVEKMTANMGGTEIRVPLVKALQSQLIPGYPKLIFLLTDGEVSDQAEIFKSVKKYINFSRVHAIGIGSGASQSLIKGCAQNGKGFHIFIKDEENPSKKIIELLSKSLTPVINQLELKYDEKIVQSIVPNPKSLPYILKGELINFYITFKNQLTKPTTISLEYRDTLNNLPFKGAIQINPQSQSQAFIDKMAHFKEISALQRSQSDGKQIMDYLYYVKKVETHKEIIELSVKHQIISKYTSFVCAQKDVEDHKYQQFKQVGQKTVDISQQKSSFNPVSTVSSFFQKLFGKKQPDRSSKPAHSPPKPVLDTRSQKIQQAQCELDSKILNLQKKKGRFQDKIVILKGKAQELAINSKQSLAKKYLQEVIKLQERKQEIQLRQKVLKDQKYRLQQSLCDNQAIGSLDQAQNLRYAEKDSEKMQDIMLDAKQMKMRQSQINQKLKDLMGQESEGKEEEVDQMYKELVKQINKKRQNAIPSKSVGQPNINKKTKQIDDIEEMLKQLGQPIKEPITSPSQSKMKQTKEIPKPIISSPKKINQPKSQEKMQKIQQATKKIIKQQQSRYADTRIIKYNISQIVKQQHFEGYWTNIAIIQQLLGTEITKQLKKTKDLTAMITYLIMRWIQIKHQSIQYSLILRKAESWLKKQPSYASLPAQYQKYVTKFQE